MSTATTAWAVDQIHSTASFAVRHMGVSTFRAGFSQIDAALDITGDEPKLVGRVKVESIDVRDENLRGHLYAEDFFDVASHPEVVFTSTRIERGEGDAVTVEGELEIKGVTKTVVATGELTQPTEDPFGGVRVGVDLTTTLDRRDFGLTWNQPLPKGGDALANEVTLNVHIEFAQA